MKKTIGLLVSIFMLICINVVYAGPMDGVCTQCEIDSKEYISGVIGEPLSQTATINIYAGEYNFDIDNLFEGDDVTKWFTNLPGEDIICSIASINEKSMTILLEGTPSNVSNDKVLVIMPNEYILDDVGPIDDEGYSDVSNECYFYDISIPELTCSSINIKAKTDEEINEEISISLLDGYTGTISFKDFDLNGLSFKLKEYNTLHTKATISITGKLKQAFSLPIELDSDSNSYGLNMQTKNACVIAEIIEEEKPVVPFIPVQTGIE